MTLAENRDYSWVLKVKDLGKISTAEIAISPMTLFVGDNNSGKSYLMTLLYTLLNVRWYSEKYDLCKDTQDYNTCGLWLRNAIETSQDDSSEIEITQEIQAQYEKLLNKIIKKNLKKLSQRGFNTDIGIGSVSIQLKKKKNIFLIINRRHTLEENPPYYFSFRDNNKKHPFIGFLGDFKNFDPIISIILEFLLKSDFKFRFTDAACFLPAPRTGFLLNYRKLIYLSLSNSYDEEGIQTERLSRPCSDFLKILSSISSEHVSIKYSSVIGFLEENMAHGTIVVSSDTPQPSIIYRPKETDVELPMYLSSGVITEIAPLMLILMHYSFEVLFIEEPEISLHPQLQQVMARALVKLCNHGLPLFITTHSDVILQQINNMIKLNRIRKPEQTQLMKQFGYEKDDLLNEEKVIMYQFDVDSETGKTKIQELPCGPYGFEIPSFNVALEKLLIQTKLFEEKEE